MTHIILFPIYLSRESDKNKTSRTDDKEVTLCTVHLSVLLEVREMNPFVSKSPPLAFEAGEEMSGGDKTQSLPQLQT